MLRVAHETGEKIFDNDAFLEGTFGKNTNGWFHRPRLAFSLDCSMLSGVI